MTTLDKRTAPWLSDLAAFLFCTGSVGPALAQEAPKPPCSEPEARQFDFRVGDWDIELDDGKSARVHCEAILGGCVIEEMYYDPNGNRAMSWARYVPATDQWKQIWVDSNGAYFTFSGAQGDEQMQLTAHAQAGSPAYRMRWDDVQANSFDWHFDQHIDEGWQPAIGASYTRRETSAEPYGVIPEGKAPRQVREAFGFWAGEWDLTWSGGAGTNTIKPVLGGAVLHESFVDPTGFEGQSITVWDAESEVWRQVWVDNAGAYLEFSGTMKDGERILTLDNPRKPGTVTRMRWHGVTDDSFTWTYESKPEADSVWKTNWHIEYTRRAAE